jgi:transposase
MNSNSSPPLFDNTDPHTNRTRTSINPTLWFDDCDGYRVIFCRHENLYRFALNDTVSLALIAVSLRQSGLATQIEIANSFGHSVATQRRWETRYCQYGLDGLQPKSPTGRHAKLHRSQPAFVQQWFQQGVSNLEMARRLGVSEATIRRVLQQAGLRRQPMPEPELRFDKANATLAESTAASATGPAPVSEPAPVTVAPLGALALATTQTDAGTLPCSEATPQVVTSLLANNVPANVFTIDRDPTDRSGDRALARLGLLQDAAPLFDDHEELPRAGVLLAVPVLQAHGGLEVFTRLFGSLGPAFYGLRSTVLSLVLMALLRIKRAENLKEYSPENLGYLLGLDRIAEVKTMRRKLTLLAEQGQGRELMNQLARLRISQDEDRLAFLYLDGHVREYSGKETLAKAKKAQRAVATTAATDTWLHDADGAPLLVVTSEMNAGLTKVLEAIVADAKEWLTAGQRLTVLFDRGGWSVKLFARLQAQGVDLITYRKGKRQPIARSHFTEHKVPEDGKEKTYWLYDQPRVRVGRLRSHRKKRRLAGEPEYLWLRQITVLREDGRQTVIVTTRTDLTAVEVVRRLFRRWRQENYFKYMAEEFALDALVEYGVEDVSEELTRPNPERKRVGRERKQAAAEVIRLRAHLGAEAEANEEQRRPTMRGFKVAQSRLRQDLAQAELRVEELTEQERQLPKRVPGNGLKKLKQEKKLIVDAIKMIAFQCETNLLERLRPHYARTEDEGRTLLHAAFQASARMEVTETELHITLAAQSSPHRGEALAKVCQELVVEGFCYPGSSLRVRLAIEGQKPLTE